MDDNHDVESGSEWKVLRVDDGPELPFEPVALYCSLKPASRSESHAGFTHVVREHSERHERAVRPAPPSVDGAKRSGQFQSRGMRRC